MSENQYRNLNDHVSRNVRLALRQFCVGISALALVAGHANSAFAQKPAQAPPQVPTEHTVNGPASVSVLSRRLLNAVVNIATTQKSDDSRQRSVIPRIPDSAPFEEYFKDYFNDEDAQEESFGPGSSLGSGFIIDARSGLVVTNNHVIADADEIIVNLADGTKRKAELVGVDTKTDIAVLKIDVAGLTLTEVPFGASDDMNVGDWVLAIGNPFGFGGSVSIGIVSAQNRQIGSGPYDDYIQTDAAINRGNSGGPLFNMNGEVIGINTAIISPSGGSIGIGFAIPSKLAKNVVAQLAQFGETRRGWLGIRIQPVTERIAESLGLGGVRGALIGGIEAGGPAEKSALKAGDVVVSVNGTEIDDVKELSRIIAESAVGEEVEIEVVRDGASQTLRVTLGRLVESAPLTEEPQEGEESSEETTLSAMGMTLTDLSPEFRKDFDIVESVTGILVSEVEDGAAAARQAIAPGDVIAEIDQQPVLTIAEARVVLDEAGSKGRRQVYLLVVSPDGTTRFVNIKIY